MLSKGKAKEGQNIFSSGSMTGIAITFFVKNPQATSYGNIFYHNIGDDLTTDEKKKKLSEFVSISGISMTNGWQIVTPDIYGDWINKRDSNFSEHISLGDKKDKTNITVFNNFSLGVATNRDPWVFNASKTDLTSRIRNMIDFYNEEVKRYQVACKGLLKTAYPDVGNFVNNDPTNISWTRAIKNDLGRSAKRNFNYESIICSLGNPPIISHIQK